MQKRCIIHHPCNFFQETWTNVDNFWLAVALFDVVWGIYEVMWWYCCMSSMSSMSSTVVATPSWIDNCWPFFREAESYEWEGNEGRTCWLRTGTSQTILDLLSFTGLFWVHDKLQANTGYLCWPPAMIFSRLILLKWLKCAECEVFYFCS